MRRKKREIWLIALLILSILSLSYLIYAYPPGYNFSTPILQSLIPGMRINILLPVLGLFFLACFSLAAFALRSKSLGVVFGLLAVFYMVLRSSGLVHPFFALITLALFITIVLYVRS